MQLQEFHYRIPWRLDSSRPGHHRSHQSGGGLEYRGLVPFMAAPDPRRVDLRASLRDIWQQLQVRVYNQTSAIPVYALVDLSASMDFTGAARVLDIVADFIAALSYSAYRTGDPFGVVGFDDRVRPGFYHPATHDRGMGVRVAAALRDLDPAGRGSRGLVEATRRVGARPALVFIVSDFHFDQTLLSAAFAALTAHQVVPVVISESAAHRGLPAFGLARMRDRETGRERTLFLRPALNERIRRRFERHRATLEHQCMTHGSAPLFVDDAFSAEAVTRYFYGR